jgi:hypothetical protein
MCLTMAHAHAPSGLASILFYTKTITQVKIQQSATAVARDLTSIG